MTWVIAGLIAPFLWAVTNTIDQIIVRKFYVGSTLLIMALSGFVAVFPLIGIVIYKPGVLLIEPHIAFLLSFGAIACFAGYYTYFKAIEADEASNAIPVFQLIPIFIFIAAYFLFGEIITSKQILGATLIIIAAISLNIDFENNKYNWKTLYLMGFCALILSGVTLLDRYLLESVDWLTAMAWKLFGHFIFFLIALMLNKKVRTLYIQKIKRPFFFGVHLLFLVEVFAISATALFILSLETTPAAGLTSTLNGFQPIYVLMLGYIGYGFMPEHFRKPKQGKHLGFHLFCLTIMLYGLYLIY